MKCRSCSYSRSYFWRRSSRSDPPVRFSKQLFCRFLSRIITCQLTTISAKPANMSSPPCTKSARQHRSVLIAAATSGKNYRLPRYTAVVLGKSLPSVRDMVVGQGHVDVNTNGRAKPDCAPFQGRKAKLVIQLLPYGNLPDSSIRPFRHLPTRAGRSADIAYSRSRTHE